MTKYSITICFACFSLIILGQNIKLVKYDEIKMNSKVLKGEQTLFIHLPENYPKNEVKRFPLIYVLDPEERFAHTLVALELLAAYNNSVLPECILVGIKSNNRYKDFTPITKINWQVPGFIKEVGGAETFKKYIAEEVIPTIDKKYRTEPFRVLIGHSMGGLFTIETLINDNQLFKGYIALDPSTFWNDGDIVNQFIVKYAQIPNTNYCRFFMADGLVPLTMDVKLEPNHEKLENFLTNKNLENIHFELVGLRGESHNEMPFQGVYLGLKSVFYDYRVDMPWKLSEAQIAEYYKNLSVKYGYPVAVPDMLKNRGGGRN